MRIFFSGSNITGTARRHRYRLPDKHLWPRSIGFSVFLIPQPFVGKSLQVLS
jgi:hypothetical protein